MDDFGLALVTMTCSSSSSAFTLNPHILSKRMHDHQAQIAQIRPPPAILQILRDWGSVLAIDLRIGGKRQEAAAVVAEIGLGLGQRIEALLPFRQCSLILLVGVGGSPHRLDHDLHIVVIVILFRFLFYLLICVALAFDRALRGRRRCLRSLFRCGLLHPSFRLIDEEKSRLPERSRKAQILRQWKNEEKKRKGIVDEKMSTRHNLSAEAKLGG